ncbi:MAG TPA: hypothetical protein DEF85_11020 [Clostridiaceae bacterium]|jgi:hypothetical protein|nr:hypothetical protein [Clostridiaceae bacterium]HBF77954.1 hypothetical protein [Clostridiaceae bacterium]HBG38314.1 hypothetical protein [Clostridiaceae bacterium]HBN28540.1 hypothetical protein [Clostridiaceae bacterium]HBX49407.1 hypothetical protein [Clostridiaceae bacterium]
MKISKAIIISTIILGLAMVASSIIISYTVISGRKLEEKRETESYLLTDEDAAKYINMPLKSFQRMMNNEEDIRNAPILSYELYEFMPCVKIQGKRYYNKENIDKWLNYAIEHNRDIK